MPRPKRQDARINATGVYVYRNQLHVRLQRQVYIHGRGWTDSAPDESAILPIIDLLEEDVAQLVWRAQQRLEREERRQEAIEDGRGQGELDLGV